jgi:hypothetical protein
MNAETKPGKLMPGLLAIVLWLLVFGLGLQAIYDLMQIISLVRVALGGSLAVVQASTPIMVFLLALVMLIYIIWSTEYHIKRVGTPESWRLFGWTLAVELSIILLNYLL